MSLIKYLILPIFLFSLGQASWANEETSKYKMSPETLKKQLSQVSLTKEQIISMVDLMVAQGKVTPQMGEKTKKQISDLSESELQAVINKGMDHLKTNGKDSLRNMGIDDLLNSGN